MKRAFLATVGVVGVVLASSAASRDARADSATGVELGLRTGYAIPLGDAMGGSPSRPLSDAITGMVPIWIDAGYRLNPNIYIGADFQYGITLINNDKTNCGQSGANCSANDLMFGVDFQYHLMPEGPFDPWAGAGVGYEILNTSGGSGNTQASTSLNGFQFLNLQLGGDYKAMENFGIGPFVMLSLNQYSSCSASFGGMSTGSCKIDNQALHEWLTFGVRGVYDINL